MQFNRYSLKLLLLEFLRIFTSILHWVYNKITWEWKWINANNTKQNSFETKLHVSTFFSYLYSSFLLAIIPNYILSYCKLEKWISLKCIFDLKTIMKDTSIIETFITFTKFETFITNEIHYIRNIHYTNVRVI